MFVSYIRRIRSTLRMVSFWLLTCSTRYYTRLPLPCCVCCSLCSVVILFFELNFSELLLSLFLSLSLYSL